MDINLVYKRQLTVWIMLVYADSECDGHDGSGGKAAGNVHMLSAEIGYLRHGREEKRACLSTKRLCREAR